MTILQQVAVVPGPRYDPNAWYFGIPAIEQLRREPLRLGQATVLVGENGSGKSTLIEAIASAWQRSRLTGAQVGHWAPPASGEDADLHWNLELTGDLPAPQGGCFLRAEAMHALFGNLDATGGAERAFGHQLNQLSHGEGFLSYLDSRTTERGLFLLDEPEAALSFTSCLRLLSLLSELLAAGNQVVLATHSPVLAALPQAQLLELNDSGITLSAWDELELVEHWRTFLNGPERYLRYLLAD